MEFSPDIREVVLGRSLSIRDAWSIGHEGMRIALDPDALDRVGRNREALDSAISTGHDIYGVTTGLGALVSRYVDAQSADTQAALLRSHAAGLGEPLPRPTVRIAMAVRLNGLLQGHSGIGKEVLLQIAALLNADIIPVVPRTGSLGASGDLAPSAHTCLPLIGEGTVTDGNGNVLSGREALDRLGLEVLTLQAKEALALINGTHFMAAVGAEAVCEFDALLDLADLIAALTVLSLDARHEAFDTRVHDLRPLRGQQRSADNVRAILMAARRGSGAKVQDAYSLRCVPQVHGAAREGMAFLRRMVEIDLNAVTDNPLVFDDPLEVVSAGNFHGQSLALAFDVARLAITDLASISERRTFRLVSPTLNGSLPPFLTPNAGTSHGYMLAQYTAVALLGELRALSHPVSVDSVPTSDNQEDHISFGMTAGLATVDALTRLRQILAIELLCACQALDYREPVEGPARVAHDLVRQIVPTLEADRPPAHDIALVEGLLTSGDLNRILMPDRNGEAALATSQAVKSSKATTTNARGGTDL